MAWYPAKAPLPTGLTTDQLLLRPLRPSDADQDFAAMQDRWDTQDWEDFTWASNYVALIHHEQEHLSRKAFTFTVLDPAKRLCLGCVYLEPLSNLVPTDQQTNLAAASIPTTAAAVRYWIRDSYRQGELSAHLVTNLLAWFHNAWQLPLRIFHTRTDDTTQNQLYLALGFQHLLDLPIQYGRLYRPPQEATSE